MKRLFGKIGKKTKIENFEQSHSAENEKEGFGFFNIHSVANLKGDSLAQTKNFHKKSHSARKIQMKNTKIGEGEIKECF